MEVTVITPSLPERGRMLERARQSVEDQFEQPAAHLIGVDYASVGPAKLRNRLASIAETEWLGFLDDDDRLNPEHFQTLLANAGNADVVYPDCHFDGPPLPEVHLPRPYDREYLKIRGFFPITVIVRTEVFQFAGGFPEDARYEDWELWNRIADDDGRFVYVPEKTWTYCTAHVSRRTNR